MKLPAALFFCFAILSLSSFAQEKPNIVYILLDDAGYGDLSCYGQDKFATPNIDRLASEGMRFTDHYSGSTVCAPTRCSLLTGLHTGHAFVRGNREIQPEGQAPMPADTVTIPRLLREANYTTGALGKWGLGAPGSVSDPVEHFDEFYGYNCQREAHTYYPDHLWRNRERVELDGATYSHDLIMNEALDFVRVNNEEPFFLYLAVAIPHAAMQVPEEYTAPFREQFRLFEDVIGKYAGTEVKNPVAAFAGMMTKLDEDVGRLLQLLEELEIDENTLVILSSDNGPHQKGGHDPGYFGSNGPFRGFKRDLTEGGVRVPMLARWPGTIAAGSVTSHVSAHWDMLPTFCEIAAVDPPEDTDGISLLPTLLGSSDQDEHEYLYWEFYEKGGKKAARWGDWKAVQTGLTKDPEAPIAIYNLAEDLGEEFDLAGAQPELVVRAEEIFSEAHVPSPRWAFSSKPKKTALDKTLEGVVANYATIVHASYSDALTTADQLEARIGEFVENPSADTLAAAKTAWAVARVPYLQTEAFRFYAGPIDDADGPEPLINGWPMDEHYVDYIVESSDTGFINEADTFPEITKEAIAELNEKSGETAITTGFHAIEFLLWGQDLSADGPGERPVSDYTTAANAGRRGIYLQACAELLTDHMAMLTGEWAPEAKGNYRAEFLALPPAVAAQKALYGVQTLSGTELAGERLLVPWDTQLQEDEHSCFSDTTHRDGYLDALGIENVYRGRYEPLAGEMISGPGLRALVRELLPDEVTNYDEKMSAVMEATRNLPAPFDQAILGDEDDPERKKILTAVEVLEDFSVLLGKLDRALLGAKPKR